MMTKWRILLNSLSFFSLLVPTLFAAPAALAGTPFGELTSGKAAGGIPPAEEFVAAAESGKFSHKNGAWLLHREERISGNRTKDDAVRGVLNGRMLQERMLYESQTAAYPGMFSVDARCIKTVFLPGAIEESPEALFAVSEMPATAELAYGTCGTRPEPFWSQHLLIYCRRSGMLHDVRYFVPHRSGSEKMSTQRRWNGPLLTCPR